MKQLLTIAAASTKEDFRVFWHMFDNCVVEQLQDGELDDAQLEWFLSDHYREDFAARCHAKREPLQVYLIGFGKECIGFCTCVCATSRPRDCQVTSIFLRSSYRGRGLGSSAWGELEHTMENKGVIRFVTADTCGGSSQFWHANGFRQTGVKRWEKRRRLSWRTVLTHN